MFHANDNTDNIFTIQVTSMHCSN